MIHSLNRKCKGGNAMLKGDMAKAYDRVDCKFLQKIMEGFSSSSQVKNLISKCVEMLWFSITMNGTYIGFFKFNQGLRQGNHLSPYLFILMEEVLS